MLMFGIGNKKALKKLILMSVFSLLIILFFYFAGAFLIL